MLRTIQHRLLYILFCTVFWLPHTLIGSSSTFRAGIDNLFNCDYSDYPGIPMPGITGTAAVEITI